MPSQVDPRYFSIGNSFLGGIQQADDEQQQQQLMEMRQRQQGMDEQHFAMQQDQYLRAIQAQQQQGQQDQVARQQYAKLFEEVGLDPGLADTEGADELAAEILKQKVAPPEQPDLMMGPDGRMVPKVAGAMGYIAPRAAEKPDLIMDENGVLVPKVAGVKPFNKSEKPPVVADPAAQAQDSENVLAAIKTAKSLIGFNTTGFVGQQLGQMGGTDAYDLRAALDTVKASIGFDRLQRMREESKTGGALGQVAVRELDLLQATIASIDANQSGPQLAKSLDRVQKQYEKAMASYQQALGGAPGPQRPGQAYADADKERRYQEFKRRQTGG